VRGAPLHRRLIANGLTTFVRGIEITLEMDETAFQGGSAFLLGMILEKFLALHAPINSFTETVIRTTQRGQLIRWPTQPGRRPQTL
jgi:type VI secretion system protein ImpG